MFLRFLGVACIVALASSSAFAQTMTCEHDSLATTGFKSRSAAESRFPKIARFTINGDAVASEYYGPGKVRSAEGRVHLTFEID